MKKKYLLIICAILFLISITGVWASEDVNQTLNAETPDALAIDMNIADEIGLNDNEEVLTAENTWYVNSSSPGGNGGSADPFNNLQDAIDKSSDGDTIMIASGNYAGEKNTGLKIEKNNLNFIKNGDGEAVFDGQHNNRIWTVTATSITIKGLTFQNGHAGLGGALYFSNDLINSNIEATFINNVANLGGANYFAYALTNTIINGNYIGNTAQDGNGGANLFYSELTNVTITGNYANNTASYGGANNFKDALTNTRIIGNYTLNKAQYGGANLFYSELTNVTITGNYSNNTAQNDGGANYFLKTLTNTTLNGNYDHNKAQDHGGANGFNELINTRIIGNYIGNTAQTEGGANCFNGTLTNTTITGNYTLNKAQGHGGANCFYKSVTNVTINGNYNYNTAKYGGANHFDGALTNANITGDYSNNKAQGHGGANYFKGTLNNTSLNGNYANNAAEEWGGANIFENTLNSVNIIGNYTLNTAQNGGGGANYFNQALTNTNMSGNYANNTAKVSGGANYFQNTLTNVNIIGNYNNNTANGTNDNYDEYVYYCAGGGANYFDSALINVNITGDYAGNIAETNGGANLFRMEIANVTIEGNYTQNTANGNKFYIIGDHDYFDGGGANYFQNTLTNTTLNGNYYNNTAQNDGGANCFLNTLTNVNIIGNYYNNTAQNGGGGANCINDILINTTINGNYYNNTAQVHGGANFFFELINVTMNGNYNHNKAQFSGGANYVQNRLINTTINGNYNNNTARYDGGANSINSILINTTINGNYTNNTAQNGGGGANFFFELINVTINGNYYNNTAQNGGGGANYFLNTLTNVNISGNYYNNTAQNGGANFFLTTLTNTTLNGNYTLNTAQQGSGGANWFYGLINVTINGNYNNNKAQVHGGANWFFELINVTMNGNYNHNKAQSSGGANYFQNTLANTTINGNYNNNTARYGGANSINGILINTIINGNYTLNTAQQGSGGANRFYGLINVTINGNYANNTAKESGGANFFISTLTNTIINGNYSNNTAGYGGANCFLNTLTNTNINGNYNNNTANGTNDNYDSSVYYCAGGGANYFDSALINVNITGDYAGNIAETSGGANLFRMEIANVTIEGNYTQNTANGNKYYVIEGHDYYDGGGANYFQNTLNNIIINGNYTNNTAQAYGGANYFNQALTNTTISGNYVCNTAGKRGGANRFHRLINTTITGNYTQNTAGMDGGANFFISTLTNTIINGNYSNNTAGYGGANYFQNELTNTNITGNYALNNATYGSGGANFFGSTLTNTNMNGNYINNTGNSVIYIENSNQNNLIENSIFINDVQNIKINSGKIRSINNWFGNNATNYNITPNVTNMEMDHWLFLNATANPNTISSGETSDVIFKLYVYNSTSKNITDYDNSLMQPIELTLNASNGEIDKKAIALNGTVKYTQNSSGKGSVTATFENVRQTVEFEIKRIDPQLSVHADEISYGENAKLTLDYNSTATGKVNITLKGKKHNRLYENMDINSTITLKDNILPDEYEITVTYSGDKNFQNATAYANMTVKSLDSNIKVTGHAINVTDTNGAIFTVTLPENATGKLNISNGQTINVAGSGRKENNTLTIDIANAAYPVGEYNWTFTYYDDDIYADSSANAIADILIIKTQITPTDKTMNLTVGDASKITYTLNPADAVGNITFKSTNSSVADVDSKGNVRAIGYGSAVITVSFEGCENYTPSNASVSFNIAKAQSALDINGTSIYFGEVAILNYTTVNATGIEVTITDWLAKTLTEGVDYNITITDSQIIVMFFDDGTYTVNATTKTDKNHNPATKNVTVNVNPICDLEVILTPMNATANYADTVTWNATIINHGPSSPYNVYIEAYAPQGLIFKSQDAYVTSNYYKLSIPFTLYPDVPLCVFIKTLVNVSSANLTLNVSVHDAYFPDPKPENNNASATVEIEYAIADVNITAPSQITVGDSPSIEVNLPSDATGNVTLNVDGSEAANVALTNGSANITLQKLSVGNHTIEISYAGDEKYAPNVKNATIAVIKKTTAMTAKDVNTTYNIKNNLVISLTDSKGNPLSGVIVSVELSKTENYTTDENGQINVSIEKLAPKTYAAKITFEGNENYTASNTTANVTVKKATPKIAAKAKTFKDTTKTKKYTVTLKDNTGKAIKNADVTLKVNGKTYTAKTNSKGKATFKITKLNKKGKYTATITYKANKYYNKATKKAKITVKQTWKTISKGSKDHAMVKKIQKALKDNGYYLMEKGHYLKIDGLFHKYTEKAVKQFQKANGLKVTGKVDYKTAQKLKLVK